MANCTSCAFGYQFYTDTYLNEQMCVESCRFRMIHVSMLLLLIGHVWFSSTVRCVYNGFQNIFPRYRTMTAYTANPHTSLHRSLTCITFLFGWSLSMVLIDEMNEIADDENYYHGGGEYSHGGMPLTIFFQLLSCMFLPLITGLSFTKGENEDDTLFREFGAGWRCTLRCSDRAHAFFAWFWLFINVIANLIHGAHAIHDPLDQYNSVRAHFHAAFLAFAVIFFLMFVAFLVNQLVLFRNMTPFNLSREQLHKSSYILEAMLIYAVTWQVCIGSIQRANEQRNHGMYCGAFFGLIYLILDLILMIVHPWVQHAAGKPDGCCPKHVHVQAEAQDGLHGALNESTGFSSQTAYTTTSASEAESKS